MRRLDKRLPFGHLTEIAGLEDKAPSDQTWGAKSELKRNDPASATTEHQHVAKMKAIEEGRCIVGVLR